jgi:class 3 adenylate cyclase
MITAPFSAREAENVQPVETRYAKTPDGVYIAYQVVGEGPLTILEISDGTLFPIDATGEQPRWQEFVTRLEAFSRLIRFDLRGIGMSDPVSGASPPTAEQWATDALAVLDAEGVGAAALLAASYGGLSAIFLAATHPDRVRALVLVNAFARLVRADDYPEGIPESVIDRFREQLVDPAETTTDDLPLMAPALAGDAAFRQWWRRTGRRGASPATASSVFRMQMGTDVRPLLADIRVPTLVVHSRDNQFVRFAHGRYLSERIPGARLVELAGADHVPWAVDADVSGDIEEFLTGARHAPVSDRLLAAVLFTDIVSSTEHAASAGDRAWRDLLDRYDVMADRQVERFGGRLVKTTGDGTLATFDGPARATQCAAAIRDAVAQIGLEIRAGIHIGEIERRGDDIAGIAVHVAQRVSATARSGEVLVSRTLVELVAGSGLTFEDRGDHDLRGVPGVWRLFALAG